MHLTKLTINPSIFPVHDRYPFHIPAIRNTRELSLAQRVTFFSGENGSGKSTLLRAVAKKANIHLWQDDTRSRYDYNPYENSLDQAIDINWAKGPVPGGFFNSQHFSTFTRMIDSWASSDPGQLDYFGGKSLVSMSHGQALMAYFKARYSSEGLFLLDEPETALSPKTQLNLLSFLATAENNENAQFIIATHSPILLSLPGALIYHFGEKNVHTIKYRDTEHYKVYMSFFERLGETAQ